MAISFIDTDIKSKLKILLSILFIEYLTVQFSDFSFSRLNGDSLFSIGVDPFFDGLHCKICSNNFDVYLVSYFMRCQYYFEFYQMVIYMK